MATNTLSRPERGADPQGPGACGGKEHAGMDRQRDGKTGVKEEGAPCHAQFQTQGRQGPTGAPRQVGQDRCASGAALWAVGSERRVRIPNRHHSGGYQGYQVALTKCIHDIRR